MATHHAEDSHATDTERFLHEQGYEHLRVRKHGALLIIESGLQDDPVNHARFRRVSVNYWTLEMATHMGQWEPTGMRDVLDELKTALVRDFGWTLSPIA